MKLPLKIINHLNEIFDKYQIIEEIGRGVYGVVYKIRDIQKGNTYVVKKIQIDDEYILDIEDQIYEILGCSHPNLICLKEIWYYMHENDEDRYREMGDLYYIFNGILDAFPLYKEYYKTNNDSLVVPFTNDFKTLMIVILDVIEALKFIHSKNILHLDLKGENIIVEKTKDKYKGYVIDFGLSCLLEKSSTSNTNNTNNTNDTNNANNTNNTNNTNKDIKCNSNMIGTYLYMAPEILEKSVKIDFTSDIYSLGVIMYKLFYKEDFSIFDTSEIINSTNNTFEILLKQKRYNIKQNEILNPKKIHNNQYIPENYINLISKIMSKDQHCRPSLIDISNEILKL